MNLAVSANVLPMAQPGRPAKTPINPQYPNRLREVRLRLKASRETVAEILHIDPSSVGRYERGEQQLGINQISALSAELHAPVADFFPINFDDTIDVVGEIHSDGVIRPFTDNKLRAVQAVTMLNPRLTHAAQVRDQAFFPLDDRVVVYFEQVDPSPQRADAFNRLAVIRQNAGAPLMIGRLMPRHPGTDTYMLFGSRGMLAEGNRLESIAIVRMIRAADTVRWHHMDDMNNRDASGNLVVREAAEEPAKFTHRLRRTN